MAFPAGNIYYGDTVASADVTDGSEFNEQLTGTEPANSNIAGAIAGGQSGTFTTFTAIDNDPNLTSWPSGDYIAQVNMSLLGADVTWGMQINRVNSSGTIVETLASVANTTYATATVQTLTWNNATDKTVDSGDRLQIAVTGARSASHGNQDFNIEIGTGVDSTTTKLNVPATVGGGTNMKINIGDVWKDVDAIKINIGDVWKDVTSVKQNIGDVWKDVF